MGEHTESGLAEAQLAASVSPSDAVEPSAFYSLYLGGLSFEDRRQRIRATAVIMLGGRLGLRPGEMQHLHEEWIDWGRGELRIPERDPCACQQCWETARHAQRAGDGRGLVDIVTESTWSPPGEGRTIPFGWSRRLTAVLAMLCEEEGYLDLTAEAMGRLISRSARQAGGLNHEEIDAQSLRATATAFFADAGFSPRRVAALLGEEVDHARAFNRQEGGDARRQLSELFDGGVADPGDAYTLVADPEPFDREPFDPRTYDADWRQTRMRQRASEPESLRNPRPVSSAATNTLDRSDLGTRAYLDASSDLVDETDAASRLDQWVTRQEAQRRGREPTAAPQQSPSTAATDDATDPTQSTEPTGRSADPTPSSTDDAEGSTARQSSPTADQQSGSTADQPATEASTEEPPGGGRSEDGNRDTATASESTAEVGDATMFNPRDQLSGPPVFTVETTVACGDFAGGGPTEARVFLGPEELLFVRDDDSMVPDHARIELSTVVDQSLDYLPDQLEDVFESAVTLAYNRGDERRLAVVQLAGNDRIGFANEILKQILSASAIVVTHPARRGGRVMSTDPVDGELSVDDRSVSISVDDEETEEFTIQLSDIIYFELEKQTFEEERFRSLSVRHLNAASEAIKTTIAVREESKHKLFQRFIRRSYQERKKQIESLTLNEEYKEVLVALYSAGDQFDISMIIDKPAGELQDLLQSLGQVGLVRMSDSGAVLTGLGHVVVNEKIEDVNV